MSSLTFSEKMKFESLLGMSTGYILDLTNSSFQQLISDTANVDIYDLKYSDIGDSKAKRLRPFWNKESDLKTGKVLEQLLEIWNGNRLFNFDYSVDDNKSKKIYEECVQIVNRLLKNYSEIDNPNNITYEKFLEKKFDNTSLNKIEIDESLKKILNQRIEEIKKCLDCDSPLSVVFLCGSVLEGILLNSASRKPNLYNQAKSSPKDKTGKVLNHPDWKLTHLIDAAHEVGDIDLDVKKFSHNLKDFRNYIHPYNQMLQKFTPNKNTAEICWKVLQAAIEDLNK